MAETEKKKKNKSNTTIIRELRQRCKIESKNHWDEYRKRMDLLKELEFLKKYLPFSFYKIKFKIKANDNILYDYERIVSAYSIEHAILKIKENKTYPDSFELLNVISWGK